MLEQLLPLLAGGGGGILGGNIIGSLFRNSGVGAGSSTVVGAITGAIASYFFGPTFGPIVAGLIGSGGLDALLGNGVAGLAGGGVGTIVWGIIKSMMSK